MGGCCEISSTWKISDVTENPCVLAFAILLEMSSHLLSKARSHISIVCHHRCSGHCAGAARYQKTARASLPSSLHPHRRCAPCHTPHVEWSRQAGYHNYYLNGKQKWKGLLIEARGSAPKVVWKARLETKLNIIIIYFSSCYFYFLDHIYSPYNWFPYCFEVQLCT